MSDLENIQNSLKRNMPQLRQIYHVARLGIFGSYVHGDYTETSDVDILVDFDQTPDLFEFVRLKEYLAKFLGRPVDLVSRKALKTVIRDRILKEAVYV